MATLIVAGTENASGNDPTTVAIIDASNPAALAVSLFKPSIGLTGARVAIDGNLLAVGAVLSGQVAAFTVSATAAPLAKGSVNTQLAGCGAVAVRGTLIAVGEWTNSFNARVKLIDAAGAAPQVVSTATTPLTGNTVMAGSLPAVSSVAFLSDTAVVVAGPTSGQIILIDFTNRANPTVTPVTTTFAGIGAADADASAQQIAIGDGTGGQMRLFAAATPTTPVSSRNSMAGGIGSLALSAPLAMVGSANDSLVARIDFSTTGGVTRFNAQLAGGATVALRGALAALGSILGPFGNSLGRVRLFDVSTTTPSLVGTADVDLASISSIAIAVTVDVSATPTLLDFGLVAVGSAATTRTVTVANVGSVGRGVSAVSITGAGFAVAATPPTPATGFALAANGGTRSIVVTFTPPAAAAPGTMASGALTLTTNDPAAPTVVVTTAAVIGAAVAVLSPSTLAFGSVAVCRTASRNVDVRNTGNLPLTITTAAVTGDPRLSVTTPLPLVVAPGASRPLVVVFNPAGAAGAIGTTAALALTSNAVPPLPLAVTISGVAVASPPSLAPLPASLSFGTVPVNSALGLRVVLNNRSECAPLTVTLTTVAPFSVGLGTTMFPASPMLTVTVAPNAAETLSVGFAAPSVGPFNGALNVVHNDPAQGPISVALSAAAAVAPPTALSLVLDRSGSMSDAVPGGTKMSALQDTVDLFTSILPLNNGDEVGVVEFDSVATVLTSRAAWTAGQQTSVTSAVGGLTPRDATSIGEGLEAGRSDIAGSNLARRVILAFTDGMENTPRMIAAVLPAITQAGIESYAIGLGRAAEISTAALSTLAVNSNGKFFTTEDTLVLRKQFLQVLADAFRQNVAADPIRVLKPGRVVLQSVNMTRCESSVTFTASWEDPSSILSVTVIAPDGTMLTPGSPATNRLVEYGQGATHAWYRVRFAEMQPGSGQYFAPAPDGLWTLRVEATALAGAAERVATAVLVESHLSLKVQVRATDTRSPLRIEASVLDGTAPVAGAQLEAQVVAPTASLTATMTPRVRAQALAADRTGGRPLRRPSRSPAPRTLPLVYSSRTGTYVAQLAAPLDGVYQVAVTATGAACGGVFDRYAAYSTYVAPRITGTGTTTTVTITVPGTGIIIVTPMTREGKPIGAGFSHLIQLTMKGASVSDVEDCGDGRYAFRVYWNPKGKPPAAMLSIAGERRTVVLKPTDEPVQKQTRATARRRRAKK